VVQQLEALRKTVPDHQQYVFWDAVHRLEDVDSVLFRQRCLDLAPAVAVGWLNAQSIHKKAVAISELISYRSFDVMAVTETWHRIAEDVSLRSAAPPGYAVVDAPRAAGIGGGVAVFYRSHCKCVNVATPPANTFESVCVQLTTPGGSFVLLTVYRPGSVKPIGAFFDELAAAIEIFVLQPRVRSSSAATSTCTSTTPQLLTLVV